MQIVYDKMNDMHVIHSFILISIIFSYKCLLMFVFLFTGGHCIINEGSSQKMLKWLTVWHTRCIFYGKYPLIRGHMLLTFTYTEKSLCNTIHIQVPLIVFQMLKRSTSLGQILITHNIHNKKSQLYDRIKTSLAAFYF